jgi:signal transduction histidine kinase
MAEVNNPQNRSVNGFSLSDPELSFLIDSPQGAGLEMMALEEATLPLTAGMPVGALPFERVILERDPSPSDSTTPGAVNRSQLVLGAAAGALGVLVAGQMFWSDSRLSFREDIFIVLAGSAALMVLATAYRLRRIREQHQAAELAAQTAEAAHVGLWGWRPSGDQFWSTPACQDILGLGQNAVSLQEVVNRLEPEDQVMFRNLVSEAALDHRDRECICRQQGENGINWLRFRISGVLGGGDGAVYGCVMGTTAPRQMEAEVSSLRNSLTHLTRVNLLGELGGALAHELKQPLTAILSNAQALQRLVERKEMDLDEIRAVINDIIHDDSRAAAVIEHLRSLLKPNEFDSQLLDLNDVVLDTLHLVQNELIPRKIAVTTALTEGKLPLGGDAVQLQQLLLNLIFNAADAMAGQKGGMVHIATELMDEHSVHLTVTDTGPGISPEIINRLFEPFVTTKDKGVGLGLAICRAIVKSHRGRIWAENNPSGGATFHVTLPFRDEAP